MGGWLFYNKQSKKKKADTPEHVTFGFQIYFRFYACAT